METRTLKLSTKVTIASSLIIASALVVLVAWLQNRVGQHAIKIQDGVYWVPAGAPSPLHEKDDTGEYHKELTVQSTKDQVTLWVEEKLTEYTGDEDPYVSGTLYISSDLLMMQRQRVLKEAQESGVNTYEAYWEFVEGVIQEQYPLVSITASYYFPDHQYTDLELSYDGETYLTQSSISVNKCSTVDVGFDGSDPEVDFILINSGTGSDLGYIFEKPVMVQVVTPEVGETLSVEICPAS